jgi:hypothetical protein
MTPSEKREHIEALEVEAVQRPKVSKETQDEIEAARSDGDLSKQIAILWEIVTGEEIDSATEE